jgi:putative peptidoglycan lipid II flippase
MNLLKALATVSGLTLVSRVFGFLRDAIIAHVFGAGEATDAFFVAFRIPNLLRRLFAEGAFSQAFVPILAETKERQGMAATRELVDRVATLLGVALFVVSAVGVIASPFIVYLIAPGFAHEPGKLALTVSLLRVTFPYIFFISLVALSGAVLNTFSRFAVPAITPTLLNIAFITGAAFLAPYFDPPVMVLAWAAFAGGLLQLLVQIPALVRAGMLPRPAAAPWRHEGVRRMLRLMAPALIGVSVAQISLLLNTIFASYLQSGSVSWLSYADRMMEFPTGLLGAALGTILLPSLSRHYADAEHAEFSRLLDWGIRMTLMLAVPAAVALAILAVPLIATLFYHGAFGAQDLFMTRRALVAYSIGLIGLIVVKVLAPGFYARQNIATPVRIAVTTLIATQLMNLAFISWLQHAGLALSIGLGACMNAALLYTSLRRHKIYEPQPGWTYFLMRLILSVAAMALVLIVTAPPVPWWTAARLMVRAAALLGVVGAGATTYFAALYFLGFRVRDFARQVPR